MIYGLIALLIISVIVVIFIVIESTNPLRKSENEIRESILELTPIGMSMEDVLKVFEDNNKWKILQNGAWQPWASVPDVTVSHYKNTFVERKSIDGLAGKYTGMFRFDGNILTTIFYAGFKVYVGADWTFDDDLKLIDVHVKKDAAGF